MTPAATVRVFLCTYRRNELLRRALRSLCEQTFSDWICELHNDAPDDGFPGRLVAEISDPRVKVVNHGRNLGGVETFNLMFDPRPERYISLLEDDNWWEPGFLERMVREMDAHPEAKVGWSNMAVWQEETDGSWTATGTNVWARAPGAPVELFPWPQVQQSWHCLHSTGAMLVRTGHLDGFKIPPGTRFDFADPVRERAMPHPLLFVPQPLVNFSLTLGTARTQRRDGLSEHYILLLSSFFRYVRPDGAMIEAIWRETRALPVRSTDKLILAGLSSPECRVLLRYPSAREWFAFVRAQLRRPSVFWNAIHAWGKYPELASYLDKHTRERCVK